MNASAWLSLINVRLDFPHLETNWKHIRSSSRTIIRDAPSLGSSPCAARRSITRFHYPGLRRRRQRQRIPTPQPELRDAPLVPIKLVSAGECSPGDGSHHSGRVEIPPLQTPFNLGIKQIQSHYSWLAADAGPLRSTVISPHLQEMNYKRLGSYSWIFMFICLLFPTLWVFWMIPLSSHSHHSLSLSPCCREDFNHASISHQSKDSTGK